MVTAQWATPWPLLALAGRLCKSDATKSHRGSTIEWKFHSRFGLPIVTVFVGLLKRNMSKPFLQIRLNH